MVARKKFVKLIVEDDIVQIKITEKIAEATREVVLNRFEPSLSIRTKIANTRLALEAMLKDFHLLEAALATDQIVISLDETSRYLFAAACQQIGEIREIMWVHPDEAEILDWLNDGAKSQPERQLRKYEPNKD